MKRRSAAIGRAPAHRGRVGAQVAHRDARGFVGARADVGMPASLGDATARVSDSVDRARIAPSPATPSGADTGRRGGSARRGGRFRRRARRPAPGCGRRRSRWRGDARGSASCAPASADRAPAGSPPRSPHRPTTALRPGSGSAHRRSSARAIARRWRWPPERRVPRSPMTVR